MSQLVRRIAALVLLLTVGACNGVALPSLPSVDLPSVELPAFDPEQVARLVDDAVEQVQAANPLGSLPPIAESVQSLLADYGLDPLPLPANAAEICAAMGSPTSDNLAAGGLLSIFRALAGEVGLGVGLLVSVIYGTCGTWAPFVDSALEEFLSLPGAGATP